jgi:hypothetical protein
LLKNVSSNIERYDKQQVSTLSVLQVNSALLDLLDQNKLLAEAAENDQIDR